MRVIFDFSALKGKEMALRNAFLQGWKLSWASCLSWVVSDLRLAFVMLQIIDPVAFISAEGRNFKPE